MFSLLKRKTNQYVKLPNFFSSRLPCCFQLNKKDGNSGSFEEERDTVKRLIKEKKYQEADKLLEKIKSYPGFHKGYVLLKANITGESDHSNDNPEMESTPGKK